MNRPSPPRPTALLLDFDGVLRRYDPAVSAAVEQRYGVAPGTVLGLGMVPSRADPLVIGEMTRAQWLAGLVEALCTVISAEPARALVREWGGYLGEVVPEVLATVRQLRRAGVPVALATNATDELASELAALGLDGEFDAVVNSAELGTCKPRGDFYVAACRAVATPPERCLFVDDRDRNVAGARAAGLPALRYTGAGDLRYLRNVFGAPD